MPRRTPIQLALLFVGLGVWAYGARTGSEALTWTGIVLFVIATLLRFFNRAER